MCIVDSPPAEVPLPEVRFSVHQESIAEAEKHKWIASEQAGCDLGAQAIRCWIRKHWNGFLRARWIEHLEGKHFWIELDRDDFGLLQRRFRDSPYMPAIFEMLKQGRGIGENLYIINWGIDNGHDGDEIRTILVALHINSKRIKCELEKNLIAHYNLPEVPFRPCSACCDCSLLDAD